MFSPTDKNVEDLINSFNTVRSRVDQLVGQHSLITEQLTRLQFVSKQLQETHEVQALAATILKKALERGSERQTKIENLISYGLSLVFQEPQKLRFEVKAKGETQLGVIPRLSTCCKGEWIETKILGSRGGGKANVFCFLMRVIALLSIRPKLRKFLVLDEAFGAVSPKYLLNVGRLLQEFAKRIDGQILLVTQRPAMVDIDATIYKFKLKDGETKVELIKQEEVDE